VLIPLGIQGTRHPNRCGELKNGARNGRVGTLVSTVYQGVPAVRRFEEVGRKKEGGVFKNI
jgi:hypothetical protein